MEKEETTPQKAKVIPFPGRKPGRPEAWMLGGLAVDWFGLTVVTLWYSGDSFFPFWFVFASEKSPLPAMPVKVLEPQPGEYLLATFFPYLFDTPMAGEHLIIKLADFPLDEQERFLSAWRWEQANSDDAFYK